MTLFDYLKHFFLILIILQFAPPVFKTIKKQYSRFVEPRTKVGQLKISGILYDSTKYVEYLNHFFAQPDIKAILLKIESPGGAAGTSEAIFNELIRLKKEYPQKPVVVLTENLCASGAYNIACAADHIVASPSAVIGSIGATFRYLFQLKEFIESYKIKYLSVKGGKFKSTTDPFVDMTPEELAMLQNVADDSYQLLVERVAQQRKLSPETASVWADGKLFNGNQARKLGLIDEVGSLSNAIAKLKEKALIDRKIEWVKPPKTSAWDKLFGGSTNTLDQESITGSLVNSVCSCLEQRYGMQAIQ